MKKNPKELVRERDPDAFVEDDGERVYIKTKKIVDDPCPTCRQKWSHKVVDLKRGALGSGGSAAAAWKSAAENLGLL
ncbi:MAG: hypothetical protein AAB408_03960 [Patescibacteria group bacterium]